MTRRRLPEPVRMAVAILGEHGRAADVDTAGKHFKIFWQVNGRKRLLVIAKSPGDHRANVNARCLLKRLLRQEGCA
jgi:hypothetical protein